MRILRPVLKTLQSHVYLLTGYGAAPAGMAADGEAAGAVFLPLSALLPGLVSMLLATVLIEGGAAMTALAAGLAVLAALGGAARLRAVHALFPARWAAAGTGAAAAAVLLLEFAALYDAAMYAGMGFSPRAFLYMPVAASLAMLAESSVAVAEGKGEGSIHRPFSGVKGWHLLLGSALTLLVMLPGLGAQALVFTALAVLTGAVAAVALKKRRENSAYVAALAAELAFTVVFALLNGRAVIYR